MLCTLHLSNIVGKAATSFECDGCQHHASFHSLENKDEDAILRKWAEQEQHERETNTLQRQAIVGATRKRKRVADKPHNEMNMPGIFEVVDITGSTGDAAEEQLQQELVAPKKRPGRKPGN